MNTERFDQAEAALRELMDMTGNISSSQEMTGIVGRVRQLAALERDIFEKAESEPERRLCHEMRELVTGFTCAFLPVDRRG